MDKNLLSPYVRLAMHSVLSYPFIISRRTIYDYEIIFVKDGKCRIRVDGTDYICHKNNVVFLRPGIHHSFHPIGTCDFHQPHIHFDAIYNTNSHVTPISFKPTDDMTDEEKSLIQDDIFADCPIPSVFIPKNSMEFQNIFFSIVDGFGTNSALHLKSDMLKLIDLIIAQFETHDSYNENGTPDTLPNTIKNYIDGNFCNILTLDSIAELFYMNKFTMMRQFKAAFGVNIIQYCNGKRVSAAREMLTGTNLSVKEIGERLNFTDAYSFSRFFKNSTGFSPLKFRQQNGISE